MVRVETRLFQVFGRMRTEIISTNGAEVIVIVIIAASMKR